MRFVGLTAGLVKPNTLTWNGSSRNAPDTPAGAVSADTKKATSRGISGLTSTPGPEKYIQGSRLYRNLPYSVSMHPVAERNCLINRSRSYFGVPRASIRGQTSPILPPRASRTPRSGSPPAIYQTVSEGKFSETGRTKKVGKGNYRAL